MIENITAKPKINIGDNVEVIDGYYVGKKGIVFNIANFTTYTLYYIAFSDNTDGYYITCDEIKKIN